MQGIFFMCLLIVASASSRGIHMRTDTKTYRMKAIFLVLVLILGEIVESTSAVTSQTSFQSVFSLTQEIWHWRTKESPEFATQVGINDNTAGHLDSFSKERFDKRKSHCEQLLKDAKAIAAENITFTDQINLQGVIEMIQEYLDNFKYLKFYNPLTVLEGPHLLLPHLVTRQMTLESYNDFQKLLARYGKFPRQADELLSIMKQNIDDDIMPHNISMENILDQLSALDVSIVTSSFFSPFLHLPLHIPREQRRTLRRQAKERISQDLFPSFQKLKEYLKSKYLRRTRSELGIASLPGGTEYYRALLKYYTSSSLTAQEIHSIGLSEVKRSTDRLVQISRNSGDSNSTSADILESLRSDQYHFKSEDDLLSSFHETVFKKAKEILPAVFDGLPADNLTINQNIVESLQRGRPAWYEAPSLDGKRHGILHIDTENLNLISSYDVAPASLHLTYPGQHLHAVFLQVTSSIPSFRKVIQTSRWSLVPAEFSHNEAFAEGWALYSESLGLEEGVYQTVLDRLAITSRQLMSSARLVVDTGIHSLGWSKEMATQYFIENTALSDAAIQNELQRIVTWPGQACSSKVGELKIRELSQRAKNALGKYFSAKDFHRILLECTNPFTIVQECISKYISDNILLHVEEETTEDESDGEEPSENGNKMSSEAGIDSAAAAGGNGVYIARNLIFSWTLITVGRIVVCT